MSMTNNPEPDRKKLAAMVDRHRVAFRQGKSKSYDFRVQQLQRVESMLRDNENEFAEALMKDLGRCRMEAIVLDLEPVYAEIKLALKHLRGWMKPVPVAMPLAVAPAVSEYVYEPYGVCLVMGAFNYPIQLTVLPLIGAIVAGNCAVVKPSEISENCERVLSRYLPMYLDKDCFDVVCGGVACSSALLDLRWDKIFFTGSPRVGKIVMAAAAKHLTPVSLELGGKSPTYIDESVTDMALVASRIMWGKFMNTGQTCVAPDYVLCHEKHYEKFLGACVETTKKFFGDNPENSPDLGRIVTETHCARLKELMDGCRDMRIVCGGKVDVAKRFVAPTVVADVPLTARVMTEEIFGPILPVIAVSGADEAVSIMHKFDSPLALYVFGKNRAVIDSISDRVQSGALVVNDVVMHGASATLPFGGVGGSGIGCYHGKHSFEAYSHKRAVLRRDDHAILDLPVRYPPYSNNSLLIFRNVFKVPNIPSTTDLKHFVVGVICCAVAIAAYTQAFK